MADIFGGRPAPSITGRGMEFDPLMRSSAAVVLSPHFDDAALSVGGIFSRHLGQVTAVTICGGVPGTDADTPSEWDGRCGFESASAAAAKRAAEDAASCGILGFRSQHLGERDSAYVVRGQVGSRPMPLLRDYLTHDLRPDSMIFVPLGIGGHPDHVSVRKVALETLSALAVGTVWTYAELPYASVLPGWGDVDWNAEGTGDGLWLPDSAIIEPYRFAERRPVSLGLDEWRVKRDAVLAHASQLASLGRYFDHFLDARGPLRYELIWRLEGPRPAV